MKATTITKKLMLIITLITTVLTTAVVLLIGSGYSWFTDTRTTKVKINSSVLGSYFQSGTGTEEDPYEVHTPIQLYYLAWLQDLGAFNTTYTENEVEHINQYHFYLSDDLDMSEYILPPIGTAKYPFVGNFTGQDKEGNYHKISNLTVSNIEALTDVPYTTDPNAQLKSYQIVGFFGIIGSVDGVTDNTYDTTGETPVLTSLGSVKIGDNTYTYNSEANEVKNFLLDTCTIESKIPTDNKTLVGIAAGYVAGYMSGVGVYNSSIDLAQSLVILDGENMSEKLSGYSLVGYSKRAMDEYLNANVSGEGEGWGGSINMKTLHQRLQSALGNSTTGTSYVSAESVFVNEIDGTERRQTTGTSQTTNITGATGTAIPKYYSSELGGSFFFADEDGTSTEYDLFYGKSAVYWPKTVTTYTLTNQDQNGYIITDGEGNFLKASSNGVSNTEDENDATVFVLSEDHLNFYIVTEDSFDVYYLNINNNAQLAVSTTASTTWSLSNNAIIAIYNGKIRYISYVNSTTWGLNQRNDVYVFKDGSNYMTASTSAVGSTTTESNAAEWAVETEGEFSRVYTMVGSTRYYLSHNGTNATVTTSTTNLQTWYWNETSNALTTRYNNQLYSLRYSGTRWELYTYSAYEITDGTNYIRFHNDELKNTTDEQHATRWSFSSDANGGVISTSIDGTTYYLANDNGTLVVSTTIQTSWTIQNSNFISGNYYIVYDHGWKLKENTGNSFYISDGNGNYLRATYTSNWNGNVTYSFENTTNKNNASPWTLNNGRLTSTANGNTVYLYESNGSLTIGTSENGNWTKDNSTSSLYITSDSGTKYYLRLSETTWGLLEPGTAYYKIYDSTANKYLINSGTSLSYTADEDNAAVWLKDNNGYYINNNSRKYYIVSSSRNGGNPTLSNNSSYYFTYYDGQFRYRRSQYYSYYFIYFDNNSWKARTGSGDSFEITSVYVISPSFVTPSLTFENYFASSSISGNTARGLKEITRDTIYGSVDSACSIKTRKKMTKVTTTEPGGFDTYFPLSADSTATYNVKSNNTGYFVGGTHASYQENFGDVRVSSHYTFRTNLTGSLNNSNYSAARLEVLTQTYLSNGLKRISDTYNSSNTNVSSSISSYNKVTVSSLGLQKYNSAREQLHDTYKNSTTTIYGMHFMDAVISMDNLITAPVVTINNDTYYDYEMPEDSIDFKLKQKGYINFFAGTYYVPDSTKRNNSFFSLYEIIRDENTNKITDIKHIIKIYGDPDDDIEEYIYQYEGESTPSLPEGYIMLFDCKWIEVPTYVENALYYFEVPANRGEYALGSVLGRYGAYLLYLDISANGGDIENQAFDYLTGVDFVSSNNSANLETMLTAIGTNNPTAVFNISQAMVSAEAQKVTFSRSADTTVDGKIQSHFTITGSTTNQSTNVKYYYVPDSEKQKPEFIYLPAS